MADKYLNAVALQTIKQWIEGKFGLKSDLVALEEKVDDIVAEGGEPNVIDTVKLNGTALVPDAEKAVDIKMATAEIDKQVNDFILNVDDKTKPRIAATFGIMAAEAQDRVGLHFQYGPDKINKALATIDYVDANGGKIDKIKVNGTEQTITDKAVDITVPTKVSDLTNDSNFQNEIQVQALIDAELTSVYKPGGTVEFASLPALTKDNVGYIYDVIDGFTTTADFVEGEGKTYPAHTNVGIIDKGTAGLFYDVFSGMVDMSGYWSSISGQSNTLEAMTVSEINAILDPSA